jgi:uncharacterized membrane protein
MPKIFKNSVFIVTTLVFIFFSCFTYLSFSLHDGLKTQLNDLGNIDQSLFNTINGRLMEFSNTQGRGTLNRFSGHANFILLIFVPVYKILPDPKILLAIQTLVISLGAYPIFWIGRKVFKNSQSLPLLFPFLYLINPIVHDIALYDFHLIALAMPVLMFAFYFLYTKQWRYFYLSSIILLLFKEDVPLIIFMFGLYIFFYQRNRLAGAIVSFTSLTYFIILIKVIMPAFSMGQDLTLLPERYAHVGGDIFKIMYSFIARPWDIVLYVFTPEKMGYVIALLIPVLFLPLFSPQIFLLSAPSIFINLLSVNVIQYLPFQYYYSAPIQSFIFLASVITLGKIYMSKNKTLQTYKKHLVAALFIVSIVFSVVFSPAPYSLMSSKREFEVTDHARNISELKTIVPNGGYLVIQNNLGAHFSQREKISAFPFDLTKADYILLDINDPYPIVRYRPRHRSFVFASNQLPQDYYDEVSDLFENRYFGVNYFTPDGYLLFKRGGYTDLNVPAREMFEAKIRAIYDRFPGVEVNYSAQIM